MHKPLASFIAALTVAGSAPAQAPTCTASAAEKKLAGAAKTSFLKKCERDASAACDMDVQTRQLAGAAKNSFKKKCVKDALG